MVGYLKCLLEHDSGLLLLSKTCVGGSCKLLGSEEIGLSKEDLLKKKVVPQATYDQIQDRVVAQGPKKNALPEGGKQH